MTELREQVTKALVSGICTLWDDSQDAEEAWKVARAAMNDGWPVIETALEAKDDALKYCMAGGLDARTQLAHVNKKLEQAEQREVELREWLSILRRYFDMTPETLNPEVVQAALDGVDKVLVGVEGED